MSDKLKIIRVGTIGHVDHGRASLMAALVLYMKNLEVEILDDSKIRGKEIDGVIIDEYVKDVVALNATEFAPPPKDSIGPKVIKPYWRRERW